MNYEKKYKDALERAKEKYAMFEGMKQGDVLEDVFPELKESEDDSIRKAIHIYLDWLDGRKDYAPKGEYSIRDMIAWIEKQGKNNMGISESVKQKLEDNLSKALEKETPESWNEFLNEQKSAWSEEDEKMFNSALWHIKNSCGNQGKNSGEFEVYNWLKTIKDRYLSQTKYEWSEEDEKILKEIITDVKFEGYNNDLQANSYRKIRWLKSLRPQNRWKPSDEQMDVIEAVINNRSFQRRHLDSLYEQLKKLREE